MYLDFDKCISYCKDKVDKVCVINNYSNEIKDLLYLVVPAFIKKYGLKFENIIFNVFENVKIVINDVGDDINQAQFVRTIVSDNGQFYIKKEVILRKYSSNTKFQLIDNLIHEFNHAINSYNFEYYNDDKFFYLRSGLFYSKYDINNLNLITCDNVYEIMEEVVNTKQTEEIINIVNKYFNFNSLYETKAYYLQLYICKQLLNNITFINTLYEYRISGNVDDIDNWFDNIVGIDGSYFKLCDMLNKSIKLELKLVNVKWFKSRYITKIKNINSDIMKLINTFNSNCNYR